MLLLFLLFFIIGCDQNTSLENPIPKVEVISIEISDELGLKESSEDFSTTDDFVLTIQSILTPIPSQTFSAFSFQENNLFPSVSLLEGKNIVPKIKSPNDLVSIKIIPNFSTTPRNSSCEFLNLNIDCFLNQEIFFSRENLVVSGQFQVLVKPEESQPSILKKQEISRLILNKMNTILDIKEFIVFKSSVYVLAELSSFTNLYKIDFTKNSLIKVSGLSFSPLFFQGEDLLFFKNDQELFSFDGQTIRKIYESTNSFSIKKEKDFLIISENISSNQYQYHILKDNILVEIPAITTEISKFSSSNGNLFFISNSKLFSYNFFQNSLREINNIQPLNIFSTPSLLFIEDFYGLKILDSSILFFDDISINSDPIDLNQIIYFTSDTALFKFNPLNQQLEKVVEDNFFAIKNFKNKVIAFSNSKTYIIDSNNIKKINFIFNEKSNQTSKRLLLFGLFNGEESILFMEDEEVKLIKFSTNINTLPSFLDIDGKLYW